MEKQQTILEELRTGKRPIVLFGASVAGRKIYCELKKTLRSEKGICFCDNYKRGRDPITGGMIITPEELASQYMDAVICICIVSLSYRQDVCCQLKALGFFQEQILEYPQLAETILAEHGGTLNWTDVEESYDWTINHDRIAGMAKWLDEIDRSVIDFGAGDCYLKQCLPPGVRYIPTDYVARTPEHIKFDFNSDPFPSIRADVCFLGFMLHYAKDWKNFLRSVCQAANNKVIIGMGIKAPESEIALLNGGAVCFYTDEEVIRTATEQGFVLNERHVDPMGDGHNYNYLWLLFVRKDVE